MPTNFSFRAGQYVEVLHPQGPIPLSIASGPRRLPEMHLHYRSTAGVREAIWMDELLETGEPLPIRGPAGSVCMPEDPARPLVLIAGGTGMAQVCAVVDELRGRSTRLARVDVLWCANDEDEFYCRPELESTQADWLRIEYVVDARRDSNNAGLQRIKSLAKRLRAELTPSTVAPWILLAGSPAFVHASADVLASAGIDPALAQSDVFAWAPRQPTGSSGRL